MSGSESRGQEEAASHISVKRWPSDKVKENCDQLKSHLIISLCVRVHECVRACVYVLVSHCQTTFIHLLPQKHTVLCSYH